MKQRHSTVEHSRAMKCAERKNGSANRLARMSAIAFSLCLPLGLITGSGFVRPVGAQARPLSLGVLEFVDASGANASARLGSVVSQGLERILGTQDFAIRSLSAGEASSGIALTPEQLFARGQEAGVQFLVQGALYGITVEEAGETEDAGQVVIVRVVLHADVMTVESGDAQRITAEGAARFRATAADGLPGLDAISPRNAEFNASLFGGAFRKANSQAISRLADAVRQSIVGGLALSPEAEGAQAVSTDTLEPGTPEEAALSDLALGQGEEAAVAEGDEELQQLIAQTLESLANTSSMKRETVAPVQQALERLLAALDQKASLMESGRFTESEQVDQQIANQAEHLESAVADLVPEVEQFPPSEATPPNPGRADFLLRVGSYVDLAVGFIQKIQEIRSAIRQVQEENVSDAQQAAQDETVSEPVVEQASEISGAVTANGVPVEGAIVSEPFSGASTTTDADGAFNLEGIPAGLANLKVQKGSLQFAEGRITVGRGRPAIADFQLQPRANRGPIGSSQTVRIIPSVVALKTSTSNRDVATLKGVVADSGAKPIPRALVSLRGLAVARTDSRGRYTFTRIPAGLHELTVYRDGERIDTKQIRAEAARVHEANTVTSVEPSRNRRNADHMLLGGATAGEVGSLEGEVVDAENRSLAGVRVSVMPHSGSKLRPSAVVHSQPGGRNVGAGVSVRTNEKGFYSLGSLKLGEYRVMASRIGYEPVVRRLELRPGRNRLSRLSLAQTRVAPTTAAINAARSAAVVLHGQITTATKTPIAGARVELKARGVIKATAKSTLHGEYYLSAVKGTYELTVSAVNYRRTSRPIVVPVLEPRALAFELEVARKHNRALLDHGAGMAARTSRGDATSNRSGEPASGAGESRRTPATEGAGSHIDSTSAVAPRPGRLAPVVASHRSLQEPVGRHERGGSDARHQRPARPSDATTTTTSREARSAARTAEPARARGLSGKAPAASSAAGNLIVQVVEVSIRRGIQGVAVSIRAKASPGVRSVAIHSSQTDQDGRAVVRDVKPGIYQITAMKHGYSSGSETTVIVAGQTARALVTLALRASASR